MSLYPNPSVDTTGVLEVPVKGRGSGAVRERTAEK